MFADLVTYFGILERCRNYIIILLYITTYAIDNSILYNNKNSVIELVHKKKLQSSVKFTGKIVNVQEVLNAMDAFVLPSIFEGLPVSAVEAQATGVPTFLSPNITREAGIEGLSWFNQDYWNVDQWADLIMNNIFKTDHLNATEMVKRAGFDIVDTADSFEKLYGE